jgi:hypothetical protein
MTTMTNKKVVIISSLDTKGEAAQYLQLYFREGLLGMIDHPELDDRKYLPKTATKT